MTLDEFKTRLIKHCNAYYQDKIYKEYRPHTQINIVAGIEGDLNEFKSFIQDYKESFQGLENSINALDSLSVKDLFVTGSDDDMKAHVSSYLPGLTTDLQKMAVISALQCV